jgi:hypothetical protein
MSFSAMELILKHVAIDWALNRQFCIKFLSVFGTELPWQPGECSGLEDSIMVDDSKLDFSA